MMSVAYPAFSIERGKSEQDLHQQLSRLSDSEKKAYLSQRLLANNQQLAERQNRLQKLDTTNRGEEIKQLYIKQYNNCAFWNDVPTFLGLLSGLSFIGTIPVAIITQNPLVAPIGLGLSSTFFIGAVAAGVKKHCIKITAEILTGCYLVHNPELSLTEALAKGRNAFEKYTRIMSLVSKFEELYTVTKSCADGDTYEKCLKPAAENYEEFATWVEKNFFLNKDQIAELWRAYSMVQKFHTA